MKEKMKAKVRKSRSIIAKKQKKAKEVLRNNKKVETALTNKREDKWVMADSLMATKGDAEETEARYALLIIRRNQLMDELNSVINDFVRLQALEILLMLELGFL